MMDKFTTLCSPNVRNLVASLKHCPGNKGYDFNILALKANSGYDYIQDNFFLKQQFGKKMFIFKMFMDGNGSGRDLVKWMQLGGDFQTFWIIFNDVKHV
jgi:hypothetical protein